MAKKQTKTKLKIVEPQQRLLAKIEKNIPMPSRAWGTKSCVEPFLLRLDVGDSFFLPTNARGHTVPSENNIGVTAKGMGITVARRKVTGGFRFWRVK